MNSSLLYNKILQKLKEGKEYKIVFLGDSITSAESVFPNWRAVFEYILKFSFEEYIEDWRIFEWNLKFFNYSLDGSTTNEFLKSLNSSLKEVNPDLYLIMGTSNDLEQGLSIDTYLKNLEEIFNIIEKNKKDCVHIPSVCSSDEKKNQQYSDLTREVLSLEVPENIQVVNGYEIFKDYDLKKVHTLMDKDVLDLEHPNSFGHVHIAKIFLEEAFGIKVNAEKFFKEMKQGDIKWPSW